MALFWHLRDLSMGMYLLTRDFKSEGTYKFLWAWSLACVDLHLHIQATVTSIWVKERIGSPIGESMRVRSGRQLLITFSTAVDGAARVIILATLAGTAFTVLVVVFLVHSSH
jgi:hypothetical protein